MEKVQFQQEQMLAELKDLVEKGLFTQSEVKQILKKRTAFETTLVRRVAKKGDFLRYAAYEMGLETLRKKRVERMNFPASAPSVSDYALVRRQFHIFERALKKFKADVGLWVQYIQVAKREKAPALVGRITARALQLHPNTPALYILAASHELEHLSPSSARTLLQRGLRLNAESVTMWREYVKMELGFVESFRRRWDLLGIKLYNKGKEKEALLLEAGEPMQLDDEMDGDAARLEIMNGAIVKSVISSAAKALPRIELFRSLQNLIATYPSPEPLRAALLAHLHLELKAALPANAEAITLHATRALAADPSGTDLVEGLKLANEELVDAVATHPGEANLGFSDAYAAFVLDWCAKPIDDHLKSYLTTSLQALIHRQSEPAPSLLAAHIRRLISTKPVTSPDKCLRLARRYTTKQPRDVQLWLARLDAEQALASVNDVYAAWARARASAEGAQKEEVWLWGLKADISTSAEETWTILQTLLKESLRDSALRDVHEVLLLRYADAVLPSATDPVALVCRIARDYLPSATVWSTLFRAVGDTEDVLSTIYGFWKDVDVLEAALAWSAWLLQAGRGREAKDIVVRARATLKKEDADAMNTRWLHVVTAYTQDERNTESNGT